MSKVRTEQLEDFALASLDDVDLAGLTDGDFLKWDAGSSKFVRVPAPSGETYAVADSITGTDGPFNDFNPGTAARMINLSAIGSAELTGLDFGRAPVIGERHLFFNSISDQITFKQNGPASAEANRFWSPQAIDVIVKQGGFLEVVYVELFPGQDFPNRWQLARQISYDELIGLLDVLSGKQDTIGENATIGQNARARIVLDSEDGFTLIGGPTCNASINETNGTIDFTAPNGMTLNGSPLP